jgi:hypothetical protein
MNMRDYLCKLLKCNSDCQAALLQCQQGKAELELELADAKAAIEQLELIVPHPAPPKITNIAQKDSAWVQQVIDSMNLGIQRLPLDQTYNLCSRANFLNIVAWDWVDTYEYRKEKFDCENFAFLFKAQVDLFFLLNQVGLVIDYNSGHAYNLIFYPDGKVDVLEPQSDALYLWTQRPEAFYSLKGAIVLI